MRAAIAIEYGNLRAEVVPSLGGGLARLDLMRDGAAVPILRPWPDGSTDDPNDLALYPMVPWTNRISGGGFAFGGRFHPLPQNLAGEPCPIHGDGWQSSWSVASASAARICLARTSASVGPYRYDASLDYSMAADGLTVRLSATNRGEIALPFGLGLHPWLPRTPGARLRAIARAVWLQDERHLPTSLAALANHPNWDFASLRPLPEGWINNSFMQWDGHAEIRWEDRGVMLNITASPPLTAYILYSPDQTAPFFCFEPVSHGVDAHNLPPGPEAHGLVILPPGATLASECRFAARSIGA